MKRFLSKLLVIVFVLIHSLSGTAEAAVNTGIGAQYNGQDIVFTDAAPKIINGRTMVPFRQILETMGATVTFDQQTQKVLVSRSDLEFSFMIGGTDITIKKDGTTTVKKMDVAPFLDQQTNRTYVPARFMAESMGNSVFWDPDAQTAVIIDQASIFASADQDFSIISKLLTMEMDLQKAYEATGSFQADVAISEKATGADNLSISLAGDMSGITQQSSAEMAMNMAINADSALAALSEEEKAQAQPILDMLKNITMQIKMDGESGNMYMNSNIFSLMDPSFTQNTWFKMNLFETYDGMGIDLRPMMGLNKSERSISELLQAYVMSMNSGTVDSYQEMKIGYAFMKNLLGDQAFSTTVSGSEKTHTLNLDKYDILAAISKTALTEGVPMDSEALAEMTDAFREIALNADIVIKLKDGKLSNYDLTGNVSLEDMALAFHQAGEPLSSQVQMTMDQPELMTMTLSIDSSYVVTTKSPDLTLPVGAKVVDYQSAAMLAK